VEVRLRQEVIVQYMSDQRPKRETMSIEEWTIFNMWERLSRKRLKTGRYTVGFLYRAIFIPLSLVLIVTQVAYAEENPGSTPESKTKLESFQRQTGTVVIKGYSNIGKIIALGSVGVECMEFTDATSGKKQLGVVIEVTESGRLQNSDRSLIDYDEIEPLLKGIDYISKVNSSATKLDGFEAIYKTKGDFTAVAFSSAGKVEAAVKSGYVRTATAYLSLEKLGTLRDLVTQAKQKLDSLK